VSEPWVLPPPESLLGSMVMESFRASGLDYPRATVIVDPFEVRISLLASGRFISIFSSALSARRPDLKVLPVKQPLMRVPVEIVTLKNRTISPPAQLFIDSSREIAKQLVKRKDG
jgi:DNA-binding transcriptional LysR family regulator